MVLACAAFAVLVPQAQMLTGWGQSAGDFAADGNATLRVAGYAFAIWGLIYLGILIHAVWQALPRTAESDLLRRLGWPAAMAFLGIGLWIIAAALDLEAATVALIFGSAATLAVALLAAAPAIRALGRTDPERLFVVWPLALLAGWLVIAAPLNLITVATGDDLLPPGLPATGWALLAVAAAAIVAVAMAWRLRTLSVALPVAWGLIGAFVAEQQRNPVLGFTALAVSLGLLALAALLVLQLRPSVERPPRA